MHGYRYCIEHYLPDWLGREVEAIGRDRAGARDRHRAIAARHGVPTADGVMKVLRTVYERSRREHPDLPPNPTGNVDFSPAGRRTIDFDPERLLEWGRAVLGVENPVRRDMHLFLILFLRVLGETASPVRASVAAGVSRTVAYALRRDDMAFALEWDKAVEMAMENLIGESYRRAVEGVSRPMVSGGHVVLDPKTGEPVTVVEYSDNLMMVLLKWR